MPDSSSCQLQILNHGLSKGFGGRKGLDPAVISAKLVLISQRGLILQRYFYFPLTMQVM